MMIPSVYKFEVTLDRDQIERYNRWRANLPHTPERSIVNWVSRPFDDVEVRKVIMTKSLIQLLYIQVMKYLINLANI